MAFNEHLTTFAGKSVVDWEPSEALQAGNQHIGASGWSYKDYAPQSEITDPANTIYRISISWDESEANGRWTDKFSIFLDDPASQGVTGLVVGPWQDVGTDEFGAQSIVEAIVAAREKLPKLTALFLGDITYEESEISWITQTDVSPIFEAYPELEYFGVRGANALNFGSVQHAQLKSLVVQSGGLPANIVRQVIRLKLPALTHLELWLGTPDYGGDTTLEDILPILAGQVFPQLEYLGLCNSQIADEIATALATAPILERIKALDLSSGTLGDSGAEALLASSALTRLNKLDVHHHYCSSQVVEKLKALPIEVIVDDPEQPDNYDGRSHRYVAVSE